MKLVDNGADAVVEVAQHGRQNPGLDVFDMREPRHVAVRHLQGRVDGARGDEQEERLLLPPLDEADRLPRECVGEVFRWLARRSGLFAS